MSFNDIIANIRERAEVLKAQGKNVPKSPENPKAKVAMMQTQGEKMPTNKVVENSQTKVQPPLPQRPTCAFCSKQQTSLKCPSFIDMTRDKKVDSISPDHVSKYCPCMRPKCGTCSGPHLTIPHDDDYVPVYNQQRGYNRPRKQL